MQVPASHDRRPQSPQSASENCATRTAWIHSDPPTHPSTFALTPAAAPSPLVLRSQLFAEDFRKTVSVISARREDLVFNKLQVCHAKIQGLFKDLFDFCNFQGLFKTLKTVFEIQVLFKVFKVGTHPELCTCVGVNTSYGHRNRRPQLCTDASYHHGCI